MGRWFAERLSPYFEVSISDVDREAAASLAERRGWTVASLDRVDEFDVVLLAVPVRVVEDVAADVGPRMSEGSLLMDITSVKAGPVEAMRDAVPEGVSVLGTHPMFGPTTSSIRGQTVILTPVEEGEWFDRFRDILEREGAHVEVSTPRRHDEMMSVIQGLTHFAYVSFGTALRHLDFDVEESRGFMSPVYEVMIDFAGRILGQNPKLYADIQVTNPLNRDSRRALLEASEALADVADRGDVEEFVDEMRAAADHFGDTSSSLRKSDKLIRALIEERERLGASVGREIALENTRTGAVHVGALTEFRPDRVTVRETGGETVLKTSNIRVLPDDEVDRWKAENLPFQRRDLSVVARSTADSERLEAVAESVDGVWSGEVIDRYAGDPVPDGFESVTLQLDILNDRDPSRVEADVRDAFSGLGLELR